MCKKLLCKICKKSLSYTIFSTFWLVVAEYWFKRVIQGCVDYVNHSMSIVFALIIWHVSRTNQSLRHPVVSLLARRTGQPLTLWLRGATRKQRETRRRGKWNIWARFPEWWWWHSIFGKRGWFSTQKRFPLLKKYSFQQQNCVQSILLYVPCYGTIRLPSPFVFYALVGIVIRFFDTDLSVLIRLSVIEF